MIPPDILVKIVTGRIPRELYEGFAELHELYASDPTGLSTLINGAWTGSGGKMPDSSEWGLLDLASELADHRARVNPENYAAARDRLALFFKSLDAGLQKAAELVGLGKGKTIESLIAQMSVPIKARLAVGEFLAGGTAYAIKDLVLRLATSRDEKKAIVEAFKTDLQTRGRFDGKASEVADLVASAPLVKAVNVRITKRPSRKIKIVIVGGGPTAMGFIGDLVHREGHDGALLQPVDAPAKLPGIDARLVILDADTDEPGWDAMAEAVRRRKPVTPYIACVLPTMASRPVFRDGPTTKCLVRPVNLVDLEKAIRYFASLA